jgi:type IV pilus assembly protein PilC
VRGRRAAESADALRDALGRERILATEISLVRRRRRRRRASARDLAVFTRQLAVMIEAGLPVVQCLHLLANEETGRELAPIVSEVRRDIEAGVSLSTAIDRHPQAFNRLYVSMVAAGEAAGVLDVILKRLAGFIETEARLSARVRSAMTYPAVVLGIAIAVVALILWQVVPTFTALFEGLDAALPLPTRVVVGASRALPLAAPMSVCASAIIVHVWRRFRASPRGRLLVDRALLRVPLAGGIARKVAVARFCRTLSTLVGAGVPILTSLDITARAAGNGVIERALQDVRAGVEQGQTIAKPLAQSGVCPPMVAEMVAVGETTGTLETMLARVADFYEADAEVGIAAALTLVEPALICFLGVVVGGIVVSMYLPLVDLVGQLS